MKKISVVVPIYNVEKYLEKCLESIRKQTYSALEILLVNDGATDNSREIALHYTKIDERFSLIDQKNQGLSAARNTGLQAATGHYIIFIDSDDYIEHNMLEILLNNIEEYQADMATCGIFDVYQNCVIPQCPVHEKYVCDMKEAYRQVLIGKKIPGSICNKLIKRSCIEELRFPVGRHYEDAFFHIDLLDKIEKVCVDTQSLYYYVHRSGSITTVKYQKSSFDIVHAYQKNMDMIMEKHSDLYPEAEFRLLWAYFVVLDRILMQNDYKNIEDYKKVKRFLKKNVIKVLKNPYFTNNRKISAIALKLHMKLYKFLVLYKDKSQSTLK